MAADSYTIDLNGSAAFATDVAAQLDTLNATVRSMELARGAAAEGVAGAADVAAALDSALTGHDDLARGVVSFIGSLLDTFRANVVLYLDADELMANQTAAAGSTATTPRGGGVGAQRAV